MVLVHGWGVSGAGFEPQTRELTDRFRLVVPDLPGHGDSPPFLEGAPFSLLADSVAAVMARLALQRPVLVGWSLGAMVAWDLMLRHPERQVSALVSIDMVPRVLAEGGWPYGLRDAGMEDFDDREEAMLGDWPAYCATFVPRIFAASGDARLQDLIRRTQRIAEACDPPSLVRIWREMLVQDFRGSLGKLSLPSLLIAGARSQLYEAGAASWMARQMPDARCLIFEHSGHAPQLEEPERFNRELCAFAGQLRDSSDQETITPAGTGADMN